MSESIYLIPIISISRGDTVNELDEFISRGPEVDRTLAQKVITAIDMALTEKVFLVESKLGTKDEPVYFIKNPVRSDEIVSEAMGYWMKILVNTSIYLSNKDPVKAEHYQKIFNGLLRGVKLMLNDNKLPGWRCFYDTKTGLPEFRTDDEAYSATDADIYIAWALLRAQGLSKPLQGKKAIWNNPPQDLDYKKWTDHFLARIKGIDVRKVKNKLGIERYILTTSDSWGEEDFKGSITVNPSYGELAAFMDFARYEDKNFWLKLRKDTFDIIKASYEFGLHMLKECEEKDGDGNYVYHTELEDGETLRIEAEYAMLIRSLLWKIMPISSQEFREFARMGVVLDPKSRKFLDISEKLLNRDGTWNISKKSFEGIMKKLRDYKVDRFFPDQIEVDVANDEKGTFKVRIERGALNLGPTEGDDGIRNYKGLGEDLFLNGAIEELEVPEELKLGVAKDELELLEEFIPYRKPKTVKAYRFHNLIAKSCYFMGSVGAASMKRKYIPKMKSFEEEIIGKSLIPYDSYRPDIPKYFDASLAGLSLTSYMSKKELVRFLIERREEPIKPIRRKDTKEYKRKKEIILPKTYRIPLGLGKNVEYFIRGILKDFFLDEKFDEEFHYVPAEKKPYYAWAAKRDFLLYMGSAKEKDSQSLHLLGESLLGIGEYHAAANVFFKIVKGMGEPKGEIDHKLLGDSIRNLIDIRRVLNISHLEISDDFEWLMEQEDIPPIRRMFVRLALIRELNEIGRTTEALRQEYKWFKEYNALYGNFNTAQKFDEQMRHILLSGKNTRVPIPRKELMARAMAEFIYTSADDYIIEIDQYEYKRRAFHHDNAFAIGISILGKDDPIVKSLKEIGVYKEEPTSKNPRIQEIMDIINELKHEMPEDFKPYILFAMGRIFNKMGYDLKHEIENKMYLNQRWRKRWEYGREIDERIGEFRKIVKYCDLAIETYKRALVQELELRQDPRFLEEILDRFQGTYLYKAEILKHIEDLERGKINREELLDLKRGKNYYDVMRGELREEYKQKIDAVYKEVISIGNTIINRFKPHPVINMLRFWGNDVNQAVRVIVKSEDSADPRNAIFERWLIRVIDGYQHMGTKIKDEASFELALKMCEVLPTIYVSNAEQRALFLLDAVLKMEDILFSYKSLLMKKIEVKIGRKVEMEEIKEIPNLEKEDIDTIHKIEKINKGFILIFKVLLDDYSPTNKELDELSARDKSFIEYIQDNKLTLQKIFDKTPIYRSRAYAKYGNLLWWGEKDPDKIKEAKIAYEKALEKDSLNTVALIGLAGVLLKLEEQKPPEILRVAVKALRSLSGRLEPQLLMQLTPIFMQLNKVITDRVAKDLLDETIVIIGKGEELTQADVEEILYKFRDY